MPRYRITIKLEGKKVQEYNIDDPRKEIDLVYLDYRKRVRDKNGAGRVIYFDLVMIVDESVKHNEDRQEVYKPYEPGPAIKFSKIKTERFRDEPLVTLAERAEYNRKNAKSKNT